jgi:hypothetical protein
MTTAVYGRRWGRTGWHTPCGVLRSGPPHRVAELFGVDLLLADPLLPVPDPDRHLVQDQPGRDPNPMGSKLDATQ